MMNKGLELIEAHYLFGLPSERIDVVIHPQSVIHSLVEFVDGSVLAQLGSPDMRIPIAYALAWPERIETPAQRLDFAAIARLDFEAPDLARFPSLRLAREALEAGGAAPIVLNAANEAAVAAFLAGRLAFPEIAETRRGRAGELGLRCPRLNRRRARDRPRNAVARRCGGDGGLPVTLPNPPLWLILVGFVCALGPLVFFHELGHYLVARMFRIPAETFSIGFGRELIGWTDRQGTRWKVAWLPLGGYVRFVGDMGPASNPGDLDHVPPEMRDRVFQLRPVWQRFLVVLAGPAANFLLAILIYAAFFAFSRFRTLQRSRVGAASYRAAEAAGSRPGDRILSVAGRKTPVFQRYPHVIVETGRIRTW